MWGFFNMLYLASDPTNFGLRFSVFRYLLHRNFTRYNNTVIKAFFVYQTMHSKRYSVVKYRCRIVTLQTKINLLAPE